MNDQITTWNGWIDFYWTMESTERAADLPNGSSSIVKESTIQVSTKQGIMKSKGWNKSQSQTRNGQKVSSQKQLVQSQEKHLYCL